MSANKKSAAEHSAVVATEHEATDKALFERIAKTYAGKDLSISSSGARAQRLTQTVNRIPSLNQMRILEVGCGAGFTPRYLDYAFTSYIGIDYSQALIEIAASLNSRENTDFQATNLKSFEDSEGFDVILAIGVLHHFDDIPDCLRKIGRLLKPGGILAVNEPQSGNPFIGLLRALRKRVDSGYSDDQCTLSIQSLTNLLSTAGLEVNDVRPQGFLSTPFAEVVMPLPSIAAKVSKVACWIDRLLERAIPNRLIWLSWNLVAVATKPKS